MVKISQMVGRREPGRPSFASTAIAIHLLFERKDSDESIAKRTRLTLDELDEIRVALGVPPALPNAE